MNKSNLTDSTVLTVFALETAVLVMVMLLLDGGRAASVFVPAYVAHLVAILLVYQHGKKTLAYSYLDRIIVLFGLPVLLLGGICIQRLAL